MIKLQIRDTVLQSVLKGKSKKMKNKEAGIENEIAALERQLEICIKNDEEAVAEQLRVKKKELKNIMNTKQKEP